MSINTSAMPQKRFPRWVFRLVLILAVLAFCTDAATFYLINKLNGSQSHEEIIAQRQAELDREDLTQGRIEKAKEMREHWKIWAMQHKDLLRQMLHASPSDAAVLHRVHDALPQPSVTNDGITFDDLDSKGMPFSWQVAPKVKTIPLNEVAAIGMKREHEFMAWRLPYTFAKYHDIELSRSMNPGSTHITLWASGRITRTSSVVTKIPHGTQWSPGEPVEVVPPFDEIAR